MIRLLRTTRSSITTQTRGTHLCNCTYSNSIEASARSRFGHRCKMDVILTTSILVLAGFLCLKIFKTRPGKNPRVSPPPLAWAGCRKEAFSKLRAFMRQHYASLQTVADGYNSVIYLDWVSNDGIIWNNKRGSTAKKDFPSSSLLQR